MNNIFDCTNLIAGTCFEQDWNEQPLNSFENYEDYSDSLLFDEPERDLALAEKIQNQTSSFNEAKDKHEFAEYTPQINSNPETLSELAFLEIEKESVLHSEVPFELPVEDSSKVFHFAEISKPCMSTSKNDNASTSKASSEKEDSCSDLKESVESSAKVVMCLNRKDVVIKR